MHDSKIDLSALDPAQDTERWHQLVESIAVRALARRKQRLTVSYQLLSWARPVLAAAAALTIVFGTKALLSQNEPSVIAKKRFETAYVLAKWATNDERPATSNILQVLGEQNVTK
jgi:hypothetical protein